MPLMKARLASVTPFVKNMGIAAMTTKMCVAPTTKAAKENATPITILMTRANATQGVVSSAIAVRTTRTNVKNVKPMEVSQMLIW